MGSKVWLALLLILALGATACGDSTAARLSDSDAAADTIELDTPPSDSYREDASNDVALQGWRVYMISPSTETTVRVTGESRVTLYIAVDSPVSGVGHVNGTIWVRQGTDPSNLRAPPTGGSDFPTWLGVCNLRQASVQGDAGISFGKSNASLGDNLGVHSDDWPINVSQGRSVLEMTCEVQTPPDLRILTMGVREVTICTVSSLEPGRHPCPEGPTWVEPALRWQGGAEIERPSTGITTFRLIPGP